MTPHQQYLIQACADKKGMSYELFVSYLIELALKQLSTTKK